MKFWLTLLSIVLFTTSVFSQVFNVPEDFDSIQGAIEEAEDGDMVLVAPGQYNENLSLGNASITLASEFINN